MRTRHVATVLATLAGATALAALLGAGDGASSSPKSLTDSTENVRDMFTMDELRRIARLSPLGEPPPSPSNAVADDPDAVKLGHRLFFETSLSHMGGISCATCHMPNKGFADRKRISVGEGIGERHSPSLWNAAYNRWQFWDGRADSLWSQALGPMETMHEMGSTRTRVVRAVNNHPVLRAQYEAIFGPLPDTDDTDRYPIDASPVEMEDGGVAKKAWEGMSLLDRHTTNIAFSNIGKAIEAYERKLISRRSPFDVFVEGVREGDPEKIDAMSDSAKRGLKLFIGKANCTECHSGPNFTDGAFHDNRVPPLDGGERKDAGRFFGIDKLRASEFTTSGPYSDAPEQGRNLDALTNGSHNWGAFKTPNLRNVALSPPYMHQGQFDDLREVLDHYNTLENATPLGHHSQERILEPLGLTERELDDLEAFLRSLTDTDSVEPSLLEDPR